MKSKVIKTGAVLASSAFMAAAPVSGLVFHVSPTGDDGAAGTRTKPFRTVEHAKLEVRKKVAAGLREPVTVFLRGGTYELSESLIFGPEDSGTEAFPITYAAYTNEAVVLSGGRTISNWNRGAQGQWTADLPDVNAGKWFFRQLIVADRRATRARWPDEGNALRIQSVSKDVQTFTFSQPLLKESLAGQGAELVVYEHWSVTRGLVTASDDKQLTTATPMGWIGHEQDYTTASPGKCCYIEHARAFLDKPGEWFLDKATGTLHYIPREGEEPDKVVVVAPRLERLVMIAGAKGNPVRNIRFQGIRFEHADFPLPAVGYNEIQAAHYGTTTKDMTYVHPVAVECTWAEGLRFERCRFAHLNASGIGLGAGCRKNAIAGCMIENIGGNGVMIGWRGKGQLQRYEKHYPESFLSADWADANDAPVGNQVANCHIQRCGADSLGGVGVFVAYSADTRVVHNLIHDMPYTGISVGYRWDTSATTQRDCLVEGNHIHDVMLSLADGGAIYTLGFQPGTVLRGNLIHDVKRGPMAFGSPNNGFFLDGCSKGFLIEANVVYKTAGEAVRLCSSEREWHTWKSNFLGDKEAAIEAAKAIAGKAGIEIEYRQ